MTYYANAPAPLARRVSKLDPKDRLARPNLPFKYDNVSSPSSPPSSNGSSPMRSAAHLPQTSPKGNHLLPPSSRSPSASPKIRDDTLPTLPVGSSPPSSSRIHVPPSLVAGIATAPVAKKPHVPSILRPGNPKSSPTPIVPPRPGSSGDQRQSPSRYPPISTQSSSPRANNGPRAPVSFPVTSVSNAHSPYEPPPQYSFRPSQLHTNAEAPDDLPDPYLSLRYQQPLPLPACSSPPRQVPARRNPAAEAAEIRHQAALKEEQERAKKREQEEADAELARQLDRELNLGDLGQERSRGRERHMPGAW